MLQLKLKWNKLVFDNLSVSPEATISCVKEQVSVLTSVPISSQKLLHKGRILKNEEKAGECGLAEGSILVLVGSAKKEEEKAEKPAEESRKSSGFVGLVNIGNTSFINAAIQFLRAIPEVSESLSAYSGSEFPHLLREIFHSLSQNSSAAISPVQLIAKIHMTMPQFATRDGSGKLLSQDLSVFLHDFTAACSKFLPVIRENGAESTLFQLLFDMGVEEQSEKSTEIRTVNRITLPIDSVDTVESALVSFFPPQKRIANFPLYLWITVEETGGFPRKRINFPKTLDLSQFCSEFQRNVLSEERKTEDFPMRTGKYSLLALATVTGDTVANSDYSVWVADPSGGYRKMHDTSLTFHQDCEEKPYLFLYAQLS